MAAGPWVVPELAHLNFFSATGLAAAAAANFRFALVTSAYAPNNSTDELWAAASAAELPTGGGYTAGGILPASFALTRAANVVKLSWAGPTIWTAAGANIPAWRRLVLYYLGTLNGKVNPMVAHFLGDATNIDVPATTPPNTISLSPHANGILTSTIA
jgi:hypothetical protein